MKLAECIGMQITYEMTETDFVQAMNAHRYTKGPTPVSVMVGSAIGGFVLWEAVRHHGSLPHLLPALIFATLAFVGFMFIASPRRLALKQFRSSPRVHGPKSLKLDENGLHWKWDGGSVDLEWKTITKFVESQNQFVFYTSPVLFNAVPKRSLSSEQIADLRSFVLAHLSETSDAVEVFTKGT